MLRQSSILLLAGALLSPPGAPAQSGIPRPETVVTPRAYVSLEPVPRGRPFEVAVVAEIKDGFHINANRVLQDYLIPTSLEADLPKGLRLVEAVYPPGKRWKFDFSPEELLVYEGRVTLRLKLDATNDAPLGVVKLPLRLRYQACNNTMCLPPVRKTVEVEFEVAAAGAKTTAIHQNVFSPK